MMLSESTDKLFKAFAKFQGELDNATKNANNPGVRNRYADLAQCINTAKPVLASNGLGVTQMLGTSSDGKQTLITMLTHESGQYMSSEFPLVDAMLQGQAGKNPAQVLGSAITYQRRYAFAAIIGMAQQDDDGQAVTPNKPQQPQQQPKFNPSECLAKFTSAASSANEAMLKTLFGQCWKDLAQHQDLRAKAKEVYDLRLSELTGEQ